MLLEEYNPQKDECFKFTFMNNASAYFAPEAWKHHYEAANVNWVKIEAVSLKKKKKKNYKQVEMI